MLTNISDVQTSESARYIALHVADLMQQLCEVERPELKQQPWILASSTHGYHAKVEVASFEALQLGIEPKMKLYDLRRRMPGVRVVLPNGNLISRWRRVLSTLCAARSLVWEVTDRGDVILQLSGTGVSDLSLQKWVDSLCSDITSTTGVEGVSIVRATSRSVAEILVQNANHKGLLDCSEVQTLEARLPSVLVHSIAWLPAGVRERLQRLRILSLGDVRKYPRSFMRLHFGDMGEKLSALALGMEVDTQRAGSKTVSVEKVVGLASCDTPSLPQVVTSLTEQLSMALRDRNLSAKELRLSVQCADGSEFSHVAIQDSTSACNGSLQQKCLQMLQDLYPVSAVPTSVRLSAIQTKSAKQQQDLFATTASSVTPTGAPLVPSAFVYPISSRNGMRWNDSPVLAFAA